MGIFKTLKQDAVDFLESYKAKGPASYAAAEQALGAILITDGLVGLENPFGQKKRPGIFGMIGGMIVGVIFMFIPTVFGGLTGINKMTAVTSGTVVEVGAPMVTGGQNSRSTTCALRAEYSVNGQTYNSWAPSSSSGDCSLSVGQPVTINYNPANPGSWDTDVKTTGLIMKIFFWAGLVALISSVITFVIRLLSIIFGWKVLKDGRKNAASLPAGTNLGTMIAEVKQNFTSTVFGFGSSQPAAPAPAPQPTDLQSS